MTDIEIPECPHCPDGHTPFQGGSHPWNVYVSPERDSDGQPTHLVVTRSAGEHCAQSDADALYELINGRRALRRQWVEQVSAAIHEHRDADDSTREFRLGLSVAARIVREYGDVSWVRRRP